MFFNKEGQTLYLASWEFNVALIIAALKAIILNNGGIVKDAGHKGFIVNRSIMEVIQKCKEDIARVKDSIAAGIGAEDSKKRQLQENFIRSRENTISELEKKDNSPVEVSHLSYISFILDNTYYYIQISDNPFFDHLFIKTPIERGNKISRDACLEKLPSDFVFDSFMKTDFPADIEEDRKEAANMIFNYVIQAKNSIKRIDTHRVRVMNTYNSGYHYEIIRDKERFEEVSWIETA